MAKPPKGPYTVNTCINEEKACGLCANCMMPQADPRPINDKPVMKVYISPEQIEAALKSLGRVGFNDEAYVFQAAMIAIHVMRGGILEQKW
jgi:hypothetical protein